MVEVLFLLFLTSILSPFIIRAFPNRGAYCLTVVPLIGFVFFILSIRPIANHTYSFVSFPWFEELGVAFSLYLDGLSLLFANLIMGIGAIVVFYSASYLKDHPLFNRFYAYLFLFMGAMLGLVLASNLITLFVFWELTAVSSYLLIGFENNRVAAREAAQKALLVTGAGGLALLIGFLIIYQVSNTFEITILLEQPELLRQSGWYSVMLVLILLGVFTKSAQFPFHFWLPGAMEAPIPVSAYLHSATMVQAGVYLVARFHPIMSGTELWFDLLTASGAITMIGGILLALRETDIKSMLAYTTVSALGSLMYMLASNEELVIKACVAFIFAHALYKSALFLAAGNIYKATGTRELYQVHGLLRRLPVTFITILIAASSMGGLPPLLGFYVKELVYEAEQVLPIFSKLLTFIVVLTNMGMVMLGFLLIIKPFFGKLNTKKIHEPPFSMWWSGLMLALLTLFFGLFPFFMSHSILAPAASAILHRPINLQELWHGFTSSFVLSLITTLGGTILYLQRNLVLRTINYFKFTLYHGPDLAYQRLIHFIIWYSNVQTKIIQNGRLSLYLLVTLLTIVAILGGALFSTRLVLTSANLPFSPFSIFLLVWLLVCAVAVAVAKQLIIAVIFLGVFGIGVALFFLVNAAPDVAMTQILVETLFVIIFVLALYKLPRLPSLEVQNEHIALRILKLSVAVAMGIIVTVMLLVVICDPMNNVLSQYFINNSLTFGHGRNIVNIILIDFRAFDTMGEIIVLVIAALGVFGLLKRKFKRTWL